MRTITRTIKTTPLAAGSNIASPNLRRKEYLVREYKQFINNTTLKLVDKLENIQRNRLVYRKL